MNLASKKDPWESPPLDSPPPLLALRLASGAGECRERCCGGGGGAVSLWTP